MTSYNYNTMNLKKIIDTIQTNEQYLNWRKINTQDILAHILTLNNQNSIAYYSHESNTLTTFTITPNGIIITPEQEILATTEKIQELNTEKIKYEIEEIQTTINQILNDSYKNEIPTKQIIIIQTINNTPTYNITYITMTYKTINIRINATENKIISHTITTLANFA